MFQKNPVRTTAEVLDPPLGNTRLQVTRLIVALIATQDPTVHTNLAQLGTLSVLLVSEQNKIMSGKKMFLQFIFKINSLCN